MSHLFRAHVTRRKEDDKVPVGTIIMHGSTEAFPEGWLPCWGQAVSRTFHANLFAVLGTAYGSGDGETTFNVPDLRGRGAMGSGKGQELSNRTVGQMGGAETFQLTEAHMPAHSHSGTTGNSGSHTHAHNVDGARYSLSTYTGGNTASSGLDHSGGEPDLFAGPVALTINTAGDHAHTFTTNTRGSGESFPILQPYLVLTYLIRA